MISRADRWRAALRAGLAIVASLGLAGAAYAAASNKIGTASFVTPAAADAYYGGGTSSSNSTGVVTRANELKELARALKNDPDLIYEHVRNNMATVWTYGLTKGGVGVTIDRSGTAFDQAHLMVELLREAGYAASYKVGTITLTGQQFADWTGITSATAACQLLSSGGIPGAIGVSNGAPLTSATCAYGSSVITSIEVGHVWVEVTIGGAHYVFDPAYKPHTFKTGINLPTAAGFTVGQTLTTASSNLQTGTQSGVGWAAYLWGTSSGTPSNAYPALKAYADSMQTAIQTNAPAGTVADIVGGQAITPQAIPTGGLRQTNLPYTSTVLRTITGSVPDQYRTTLTVQITKLRPDTSTPTIVNKLLYADEIYGRRLNFDTNFDTTGASFTGVLKLLDELGAGPSLVSTSYSDNPTYSKGTLTLSINMPYAASSGAYMDATLSRPVNYALPFTIVHGYGDVSRGLVDKWGHRKDTPMPAAPAGCDVCRPSYRAWKGDGRREAEAASWLAQATKAAKIHAEIAKSVWAQHYSIGVVSADATVYAYGTGPTTYAVTDSFDRIDVETGYSLTSKNATQLDRRAGAHAIASTIDALKASTVGQIADIPDTTSVAKMFDWGNAPPAAEDTGGGGGAARRYYSYTNSTEAAQALGLTKVQNATSSASSSTHTGGEPTIGDPEVQLRRNAVANAISSYVGAGFNVTASEEAFLGPGQRGGGYRFVSSGVYSHDPSRQRAGALAATKYDGNGDPIEIAHVAVATDASITGGGGGVQLFHQAQYDPALSADVLKGRFVNPPPGSVTVKSAASLKAGPSAFPYSLTGELIWRGGDAPDQTYGANLHTQPQGPWTTNWHNALMIGGSGLEAMGDSDVRAAAATISTFAVLQDLFRSSPSAHRDAAAEIATSWWARSLNGNVATVALGATTRQLILTHAAKWVAPGPAVHAGAAQGDVVNTFGSRGIIKTDAACYSNTVTYVPTRGWNKPGVNYTLRAPQGQTETYAPWQNDIQENGFCSRQRGARLTSWTWASQAVTLSYAAPTPGASVEILTAVANTQGRGLVMSNGGLGGFTNGLGGADLRQVTVSALAGQPVTHTDPISAVTKFETSVLGAGNYQRHLLDKVYSADDATNPSAQMIYDALGQLKQQKDKLAYLGSRPAIQINIADGLRSETIDALGLSVGVSYVDRVNQTSRVIDPLGNVTTAAFDGRGRVLTTTSPEGNKQQFEYDDHNNQTKVTVVAKPGSPEAASNIVTQASYEQVTNLPLWTKDAKGAQTDYTTTGYGQIATITSPEATLFNGRPVSEINYTTRQQPTRIEDWWGRQADVYYNADGSYYQTYIGDQRTNYTNSAHGYPTSIDGPRTDVTDVWGVQYDALNRATLKISPAVAPNPSMATRTTYDLVGRVTKVEQGTYASSTFTPLLTTTTAYDAVGNPIKVTSPTGVTQMSYDAANRVVCTAVRMNPAVYGSLPSDACVLSTQGTNGPDRITRNTYDAAGRVIQMQRGVGLPSGNPLKDMKEARYTFTANGKMETLTDANDNRSAFIYDGFDRLKRLNYPMPTRGALAANPADYEEYTYDVNGNRTKLRKRSGAEINYQYDALNRLTVKDLPAPDGDFNYTYNPSGGTPYHYSHSTGAPVYFTFDANGRIATEVTGNNTIGSEYDLAGNRTKVTINTANEALYSYDALNRLTKIETATSGGTPTTVATFTYDALGHRTALNRPSGANTTYGYEAATGRLANIVHTGVPSTFSTTQAFTYNPANQALTGSQSNSLYLWTGQPITTKNATHDGLNRDAAIVAAAGYDANGNLTGDGARVMAYDAENRLKSVIGTSDLLLTYDALGRLYQTRPGEGAPPTTFVHDGVRLVFEYNSNLWGGVTGGTYFVHGPGVDEPLVSYAYNAWGTNPTWLHADRQGSIIGTSNSAGAITPITYGPYGEPQTWAGSRFRYTGQIMLPEVQLYHYKARVYDPMMGRFLQTDPIGYGDGLNLYAYVGGDPLNRNDPTGQQAYGVGEVVVTAPCDHFPNRPSCQYLEYQRQRAVGAYNDAINGVSNAAYNLINGATDYTERAKKDLKKLFCSKIASLPALGDLGEALKAGETAQEITSRIAQIAASGGGKDLQNMVKDYLNFPGNALGILEAIAGASQDFNDGYSAAAVGAGIITEIFSEKAGMIVGEMLAASAGSVYGGPMGGLMAKPIGGFVGSYIGGKVGEAASDEIKDLIDKGCKEDD